MIFIKLKQKERNVKKSPSLIFDKRFPGTHDVGMINNTFKHLKRRNFKTVSIPKFDKSVDDRFKKNKWQKIKIQPDIVIFEGWCIGARHQKNNDLKKSQNLIEKNMIKNSNGEKL